MRAVVESGQPQIIPPLDQSSNGQETVRFLGGVDARSIICVPLRARGRRLGAITVARTAPGDRYGADELAFVEDLAGRIAVAVDHARLYLEVEQRADASRVLAHVADGVTVGSHRDAHAVRTQELDAVGVAGADRRQPEAVQVPLDAVRARARAR